LLLVLLARVFAGRTVKLIEIIVSLDDEDYAGSDAWWRIHLKATNPIGSEDCTTEWLE
jgi:hypothetical protein